MYQQQQLPLTYRPLQMDLGHTSDTVCMHNSTQEMNIEARGQIRNEILLPARYPKSETMADLSTLPIQIGPTKQPIPPAEQNSPPPTCDAERHGGVRVGTGRGEDVLTFGKNAEVGPRPSE